MPALIDLTGQQFGRLKVLQRDGNIGRHTAWLCVCVCGTESRVPGTNLTRSHTSSCGCLKVDLRAARAESSIKRHPSYAVWCGMKARCENPKATMFKHYGARGITVCARWSASFIAFAVDMGVRPAGTTLDRRDNNLGYTKENCRWATSTQQNRNRRDTVFVDFHGERVALADLCEAFGVSPHHAPRALRAGRTIEQILGLQPKPTHIKKPLLTAAQIEGMDDMGGIHDGRNE